MFLKIVNYASRGLLIIVGLALFFDMFPGVKADPMLSKTIGGTLCLFGIYRIALYQIQIKNRRYSDDEDDN